jgi:aldehyde:ferredoxin oxidoreductase
MDAIATGGVIAWAMECYERALLTEKEVDGLELKFGNDEACVQLISKIARREGIGDLLSQGTRTASRKVGNGSEQFAMNIKGLELPGYDIRGLKTAALCWAVATKGGCDLSDAYDMDITSKVGRFTAKRGCCRLVVETEDYYSLFDSLTICKFMRGVFEDFYTEAARLYEVVTGFETKADDLEKAGERIINLEKAFNIREGWTRKDDHLPSRVMRDPIPEGIAKGSLVTQEELDLMLDGYYEARGWTKAGLIPKKKLIEIGLTDIAEEVGV